jgi:hypothetical protein
VPEAPGDIVTVAGRTIEVLAVEARAITQVRITPRREAAGDGAGPEVSRQKAV